MNDGRFLVRQHQLQTISSQPVDPVLGQVKIVVFDPTVYFVPSFHFHEFQPLEVRRPGAFLLEAKN